MIFKDVHASIPIYIFDRSDISFKEGKVTAFTPSHIDMKVPSGKMVVDVTATFGDNTQTYTIEDSLDAAFFGTAVISPNRDSILREIEAYKQTSEQRLAGHARDEEIVVKCNELLLDNNPTLKEKRQTEERFSALEGKMDSLMEMMQKFMS